MHLLSRSEEIILMAVLNLKPEAYGIAIRSYLTDVTGFEWSIGAVYAPLHRLENKGLVVTSKGDPVKERGGRSKIYYHVTPEGRRALLKLKNINENIWGRLTIPDFKQG